MISSTYSYGTHPMLTIRKTLTAITTAALFASATACSDSSLTAPSVERNANVAMDAYSTSMSAGPDTIVTTFVVGMSGSNGTVQLGNDAKILFPYGAKSICDLAKSSYGPGTWNSACSASTKSVTITAKTWINAQGNTEVDFQPAMRFVPGLSKLVTLSLKNVAPNARIDFRNVDGTLVNEAGTDASLMSVVDTNSNWVTRIIKHFSGYTVTAD